MARLIDADALYNGAMKDEYFEFKATDIDGRESFAYSCAMQRLAEAPTVNQWISVKDRLPEVNCDVLVYAIGKIDGFIGKTQIAITCIRDTNPFDCRQKTEPYWLAPWQYFLTDYEITHWMPLPEPPKEDNDALN